MTESGSLQFVKIVNGESVKPLLLTEDGLKEQFDVRPVNVAGKSGLLLGVYDDGGLVQTFDGLVVKVAQSDLEEMLPSPGEDGGFDTMWPIDGPEDTSAWEMFGVQICEAVAWKGLCVIQLAMTPEERWGLRLPLANMPSDAWKRICVDVEAAYLGRDASDKMCWLPSDHGEQNPEDPLQRCDRALSELAQLISPMAEAYFGFSAYGRTGTMARIPATAQDRSRMMSSSRPLTSQESVRADGSMTDKLESYISFLQLRRLCMLHFASGSGGSLTLHPKPGNSWLQEVHVSCEENRLVIFRHDLFSYTYAPSGDSVALQTWMLSEPHANAVNGLSSETGIKELRQACPEYGTTGRKVGVMSIHMHYPGSVNSFDDYWNMLSIACDATLTVGTERWDHEVYYEPDKEKAMGKIYSQHGGFVCPGTVFEFDNDFFDISNEEAGLMDPGHRRALEVGYTTLASAGFERKTLMGKHMGVFIGNCGSDWSSFADGYALQIGSEHARTTSSAWALSGRLSHILGMRGPQCMHDTACSSSLVALADGHWNLRPEEPGAVTSTNNVQLQWMLALGVNQLLGPGSWIGLSAPKMLSAHGRCFTFDQSADGFNRGEGFGGCSLRDMQKAEETLDRYAMLCGSAINQDGRSASMTAPHGPSQQECIRNSLRESGITPADVRMAELHGTGTALGDPIELGALRGVMMWRGPGQRREEPIYKTSAKSNMGHLEATAGIAGFSKCVAMLMHGCCIPNVHLNQLNANADTSMYPVLFASEMSDTGNSGNVGVSSFGFGGTNARGDVWARAQEGPFNTGGTHRFDKLQYLHAMQQDFIDRSRALEDPDLSESLLKNPMLLLEKRSSYAREEADTVGKDWRLTENDWLGNPIPQEAPPLPVGPGTYKQEALGY